MRNVSIFWQIISNFQFFQLSSSILLSWKIKFIRFVWMQNSVSASHLFFFFLTTHLPRKDTCGCRFLFFNCFASRDPIFDQILLLKNQPVTQSVQSRKYSQTNHWLQYPENTQTALIDALEIYPSIHWNVPLNEEKKTFLLEKMTGDVPLEPIDISTQSYNFPFVYQLFFGWLSVRSERTCID